VTAPHLRAAIRVATGLAIAAAMVGLVGTLAERAVARPLETTPSIPKPKGCGGWVADQLPPIAMIDVAWRGPEDVWLLGKRELYHWDGCTWRTPHAFARIRLPEPGSARARRVRALCLTEPTCLVRWCATAVIDSARRHATSHIARRRSLSRDGGRARCADPTIADPTLIAAQVPVDPRALGHERTILATSAVPRRGPSCSARRT
jgi:hypothetical protein